MSSWSDAIIQGVIACVVYQFAVPVVVWLLVLVWTLITWVFGWRWLRAVVSWLFDHGLESLLCFLCRDGLLVVRFMREWPVLSPLVSALLVVSVVSREAEWWIVVVAMLGAALARFAVDWLARAILEWMARGENNRWLRRKFWVGVGEVLNAAVGVCEAIRETADGWAGALRRGRSRAVRDLE
ncbi:hypothetical protein QBC40DRAFT_253192 [Triangularia verruculosa]|uniref:Uncharacterized protein n=1 Tax=Triangularia verruculosa TaxID=2587418 RepID=A0AAN6XP80_9PEZI|nr:hypothetical protein QBC40DRAFT_253192 [Triangularia verruculosa]